MNKRHWSLVVGLAAVVFFHTPSLGSWPEASGTSTQDAQMGEDFIDNLKDFHKSVDKTLEAVGKMADFKEKERALKPGQIRNIEERKKLTEKINDNLEDTKRVLKLLKEGAKSNEEKDALRMAEWTRQVTWLASGTVVRSEYDCNRRWATHYNKLTSFGTGVLKKAAREKKWSEVKCTICTDRYVDCPGCDGAGKCGAQVFSDEKCKEGYFHASNNRLCPVCQGTSICLFCEGNGKMLCPVDHRLMGK
jgi:hypothetical protein